MATRFIDVTMRFNDLMSSKLTQSAMKIDENRSRLNKVAGKLNSVGKSFTNAGRTLTKSVTVPIAAIAATSVKVAAEFEKSMDKVASISGATGDELTKLSDKALEMGAKTKFSASESADAFSYMAMAGWKTADMLDGIEGVMYLAGATGTDLARTSDIVTDALTAFGLQASDTNHFVDVLAKTANNANTDVNMMGESFKYVGPVAGALKYSIDDVAVGLGLMANSGIKASRAGTAMRSMLTNLAKPSDAVAGAMDTLGISLTDASGEMKPFNELMKDLRGSFANLTEAEKAQYAATLAGKTGMAGLLAIVNASEEDFNALTGAIADSTGAAKEMYDVANDNLSGQLTVLKSTIESIQISLGNRLTPYVKKFTGFIQNLADKVNGLNDKQFDTIIKIAGVAAAIGPLLLVVGKALTTASKVVKGVRKVSSAMKAVGTVLGGLNPTVLIVIGVVAALAAIAIVVYKNWDKIRPMLVRVGNAFKTFGNWVKTVCANIRDWFVSTYNSIIEKIQGIIEKIRTTPGVIQSIFVTIAGYVNGIRSVFQGLISFIQGVFTGNWAAAWNGVKQIFSGAFQALVSLAKAPMNGVIGIINGAISRINSISVTIPDWVPVVGGRTFSPSLGYLGYLEKGTPFWTGGKVIINEKGGEIVDLPRGSRVIPHDKSLHEAMRIGRDSAVKDFSKIIGEKKNDAPIVDISKAFPKKTETKQTINKTVNIPKIADTIVVREEADVDLIAEKIAEKLEETEKNIA